MEEAKAKLNKDIEITNQRLAMIPTEWNTEIFCYEFQGKIDNIEFLSYINVETGEETTSIPCGYQLIRPTKTTLENVYLNVVAYGRWK